MTSQFFVHAPVEDAPPDKPHWGPPVLFGYWHFQLHLEGVDIYTHNDPRGATNAALLKWGNEPMDSDRRFGEEMNALWFSPTVIMACKMLGYRG